MRTRGYSFQLAVAGLIVVLDQLTKLMIRRDFELYDTTAVIPNLFSLTRIHNTGAAFGLLDGVDLPFKTALLAVVSVAALAGLVMFAVSLPETPPPGSRGRGAGGGRRGGQPDRPGVARLRGRFRGRLLGRLALLGVQRRRLRDLRRHGADHPGPDWSGTTPCYPKLFELGPFTVYTYGVLLAVSYLLGL